MSKFISELQISESIRHLAAFNPFFGTTLLSLNLHEVPVGSGIELYLDAANNDLLRRYFRLHPKSDYFFSPFKKTRAQSNWREPRYASTSLQAVNTQSFLDALIHERNTRVWGWRDNYLNALQSKLPRGRRLPLLHFAVWFLRDQAWSDSDTRQHLQERFRSQFRISAAQIDSLFDSASPTVLSEEQAFQQTPPRWERLIEPFGLPPDIPRESGAILRYLEFSQLGPARSLSLKAGSRLNIITGDNGLGKTFLLDIVWWALAQEWAGEPATPIEPVVSAPVIRYQVSSTLEHGVQEARYQIQRQIWTPGTSQTDSGLVVYAQVDGSFAVFDPAIDSVREKIASKVAKFDRSEVWEGDRQDRIQGLLRDWVKWQTRQSESAVFATFQRLVSRLSPPDLGTTGIGEPVRLLGRTVEVPTLVHSYGSVPVIFESAGIRRILALAYLIVWTWEEHRIRARQLGRREERQMVIILDEAEAHLHPKWQRAIVPALLGIAQDLHGDLAIQYFVASHSPLVLASAESSWDPTQDRLFHLNMKADGRVSFEQLPFELRGTADSWLQSPSFDGLHPGSESAEAAIRRAKRLLVAGDPSASEIQEVSKELARSVAAENPFWLRWVIFASDHGVEL